MDNSIEVFKLGLQVVLFIRHDGIEASPQFNFILEGHYYSSIIHPTFIPHSSFKPCSSRRLPVRNSTTVGFDAISAVDARVRSSGRAK
jgi:hypothetical protein